MPAGITKSGIFALAIAFAAVPAACGGQSGSDIGGNLADGGGDNLADSGTYVTGDDSSGSFSALTDAGISPDAFAGCAATTVQAQSLPLDLYFMVDTSESMDDLVTQQQSKWAAVSSAMTAFVKDPASAGIGVGLQYFPVPPQGVPATCTSSTQCGTAGPCYLGACALPDGTAPSFIPCGMDNECPVGASCWSLSHCRNDPNKFCGSTADCVDNSGFTLGACDPITTSNCFHGDSCMSSDYATPAVPIGVLPTNVPALQASLAAQVPSGFTPTVSALQGAIDLAKQHAAANPGHSVVAVLATDGLPDECTGQQVVTAADAVTEVANVAAGGLVGSPSIKTFVIGVFTPGDIASGTTAVNEIAKAGGTNQAFVINSTSNVTAQFTSALNSIRGASLPCQYKVPVPDSGMPNFNLVNVEYTSGSGAATGLAYVESSSRCGTGTGWYYDVDPMSGATPTAILVCPSTCTALGKDAKGRVDVVIGCQTVTR
jgi:hypothetical protein